MLIVLALACAGPPPDTGRRRFGEPSDESDTGPCRTTAWYRDADQDGFGDARIVAVTCEPPFGYVADATDCDDTRSDTFPGGTERCDGFDQNCDGRPDDAAAIDPYPWYVDGDGDGYGSGEVAAMACVAPPGMVGNPDDCDDADPGVYPGGLEACDSDGRDEDCDGLVNDADSSATGRSDWYPDHDGDGFGRDGVEPTWACSAPDGYVALSGDCNDRDASILPAVWYADLDGDGYGGDSVLLYACHQPLGYLLEVGDCDDTRADVNPGQPDTCGDPADEDCDGDYVEVGLAGCADWYTDGDGDGYGVDGETSCQCLATPEYSATVGTDCDDADPGRNPGVPEICGNDVDDDCDGRQTCAASVAGATMTGRASGDGAGALVAATPDMDGDGVPELLVGVPADSQRGWRRNGSVVVAPGSVRGSGTVFSAASSFVFGSADDQSLGADAIAGCDVDGDGLGDLLVGSIFDAGRGVASSGAAGVWLGPVALSDFSAADLLFTGPDSLDGAGAAVACGGDADGDGFADVLIGATGVQDAGARVGAAYLVGALRSGGLLSSADVEWLGASPNADAGATLSTPGDLTGDGVDDLVIGAPGGTGDGVPDAGVVYVEAGPVLAGARALADVGVQLHGAAVAGRLGVALAAPGDTDGDGLSDLLVGDAIDNAYVVRDLLSASPSIAEAALHLTGTAGTRFGAALAAPGDLDGDGVPELAIAAPRAGRAGWVFTFPGDGIGSVDVGAATCVVLGAANGDAFGASLASVPDLDGDGRGELLIGAPEAGRRGAAYLFLAGDLFP